MFCVSISQLFCVSSTHFKVMYVKYMTILYCHEQEAVRGSVYGRQVLGSLSDQPQVRYEVREDAFLDLEILGSVDPF